MSATPAGRRGRARAGANRAAMHSRPRIDAAALEARAAGLARRAVRGGAKRRAIELAAACVDLTTLEGRDTPGKVLGLCRRAADPGEGLGPVAAVCVYPTLVAAAKAALAGSGVLVASVATAFPSGLAARAVRLADVRDAVAAGADEIDMVIDRGALLRGDDAAVREDLAAVRGACAGVTLKVIIEAGELGSYAAIRRASDLALAGGADFIKTATGKTAVSSTPAIALCMAEAIRAHERATGRAAGLKLAGGIRTTKSALGYVALVAETLGERWLRPDRLRFGASGLLDDLVRQRESARTGAYANVARAATA